LDWGCGDMPHREAFESMGKKWVGFDIAAGWHGFDIAGDLVLMPNSPHHRLVRSEPFDVIWCSHVIEHCWNPVDKLRDFLTGIRVGGILAVTVPPVVPRVVSGHIHGGYTAGQLLYQLAVAGWDCSKAAVLTQGIDISVIVRRPPVIPAHWYQPPDIEQ